MSQEEQKRYSSIVADCAKTSTDLLNTAKKFYAELQKGKERDGISLYEVKNRDLLAYMHNLAYLMYQMSCGNSIHGDPAIERLVYLRTVLERIRPIEYRLKNHVEKLLSLTAGTADNRPKTLRPHPERLKVDEDGKGSESGGDGSDEEDRKETKPRKYIPPKVMAVHYNEDEEAAEDRKIERARRRALQSSLIQDLRAQYSEAPEEFQDDSIIRKKKQHDAERKKYEEDYLIRLQMTKKERHNKRLENRQNILDELLNFGSYMAVKNAEQGDGGRGGASRKRKKFGKRGHFSKKPRLAGAKGKKEKGKFGKKKR